MKKLALLALATYYYHGWWDGETTKYDRNTLGKHLQSIEKAFS